MSCSSASTLKAQATIPVMPNIPGLSAAGNQALKIWAQNVIQQVQGAAGATGVNVIPQQYALLTGATLPPIAATSNCTVSLDATKPLFGQASYKIAITGSPATIEFSADSAWPLHPGWQWIVSFFQAASAAIAGVLTITTPAGTYSTDFTTGLTSAGLARLFDTLNLGADSSSTFGLSFTFTGGSGQDVWLNGLMMEPYFNVAMQPSPFISTSSALTLDNQPDGFTYVRLASTHASNNVAYNYKGVWSSSTAYVQGDEVVYGSTYWLCLTGNTNNAPPSADWQAVGTYGAFEGAWSSTTAYSPGAEVTYGGNFWICVTANTNSAPTVTNSNWQVAGPTNLDAIADGTIYARTLAAGLTSGMVNTNGIVSDAVTNYAITVDGAGGSDSWPYTTTTIDYDFETVSNATTGGSVEVDVSAYINVSQGTGMAVLSGSYFAIYRDGSFAGTVKFPFEGSSSTIPPLFVNFSILDTPAAGSHTYTLHAHVLTSGGSGSAETELQWSTASLKMREFKR
jgi:hypothetical protein